MLFQSKRKADYSLSDQASHETHAITETEKEIYQPKIYFMLHNSAATNSKTYPALDYTHVHQTDSYIAATHEFFH